MTDLNKVNFMSKTRFDNLSSTNDDELYIVETDIVNDSDVVHKTGTESIGGNKTFSDNLTVTGTTTLNNAVSITGVTNISNNTRIGGVLLLENQSSGQYFKFLNIGITSGTNSYKDVAGYGTDNVRVGGVRFYHSETNVHKTILYTADDTNTYTTDLQICYDNVNNTGYITTNMQPPISDSINGNAIPTIGWVNDPAKSTNVVHRSGNEDIDGTKSFLAPPMIKTTIPESRITTKFNDITLGVVPTTNHFAGFRSLDSTGEEFANCNCSYNTAGRVGCNFYVKRVIDNVTRSATMGVFVDSDGTIYTAAPTPSSLTDSSTQIATTSWVNSKIQFVNSLPANPVSGVLYLIPET